MNARRDLLGELPMLGQMAAPRYRLRMPICRCIRGRRLLQRHAAELPGQMGKRHLPGADDFRRACLRAGGGLEIPSGGRIRHAVKQGLDALYAIGRPHPSHADGGRIVRYRARDRQGACRASAPGRRPERKTRSMSRPLNVAAHRLQSLIHDRRTPLAAQPGGKFQA